MDKTPIKSKIAHHHHHQFENKRASDDDFNFIRKFSEPASKDFSKHCRLFIEKISMVCCKDIKFLF